MSNPMQNLITIIEHQPELFALGEQEELLEKDWSNLSDKEANRYIIRNYKQKILDFKSAKSSSIVDSALEGLSSKDKEKKFPTGKAVEIDSKNYKQMLVDAIHRNLGTPTANTN